MALEDGISDIFSSPIRTSCRCAKSMPPAGNDSLSAEQIQYIACWADNGAKKMRGFPFWLILALPSLGVQAQAYVSERSTVTFFREAAVENLEATNGKATCAYEPASGVIGFQVPIAEFQFKKSLMKKHFNEKYMESGKFPGASFTGKLLGFSFNTPGPQSVHALGKLTIHGVTREVDVPGTAEMRGIYLVIQSRFTVQFSDYQVRIPELFWKSVAESVDVSIDFTLKSAGR